jgi:XTP/dITP diphosphohydrolase
MTKPSLVFASHNSNKIVEIRALLPKYSIISLSDLGFEADIPETGTSLEENAEIKARRIFQEFNKPVFADDTGLLVETLNGAPGVYSARYAGAMANADANMNKLMAALENEPNRKAHFKTSICFINETGSPRFFEGRVDGVILTKKTGEKGFGYDPIFKAEGESLSFAEMDSASKNKISHRGRALSALINFLQDAEKK